MTILNRTNAKIRINYPYLLSWLSPPGADAPGMTRQTSRFAQCSVRTFVVWNVNVVVHKRAGEICLMTRNPTHRPDGPLSQLGRVPHPLFATLVGRGQPLVREKKLKQHGEGDPNKRFANISALSRDSLTVTPSSGESDHVCESRITAET
jgi:hypothetical protein